METVLVTLQEKEKEEEENKFDYIKNPSLFKTERDFCLLKNGLLNREFSINCIVEFYGFITNCAFSYTTFTKIERP